MPRDLDLYLRVVRERQVLEVNYSHMGDIAGGPWALLDRDVRDGRGPEMIQIARWLDGTYRCAVHNYSKDLELAGCGAKLNVTMGAQELAFECPSSGTGEWWEVFSYSPTTGTLNILNRIAASFA